MSSVSFLPACLSTDDIDTRGREMNAWRELSGKFNFVSGLQGRARVGRTSYRSRRRWRTLLVRRELLPDMQERRGPRAGITGNERDSRRGKARPPARMTPADL